MRTLNFAKRNFKEIMRDPLSIIFTILLPLFLLFVFQQFEIPDEIYSIENFTPGIIVFSFSFLSLFTATLVAKDRTTSLITRLCASPMKPREYIGGYILAVLPMVIIQNILFFIVAIILGLKFNINIIFTCLVSLPLAIIFIALGIIIGCLTSEKASSGVGSIIVQLVVFTSGMYFDLKLLGKTFQVFCKLLPFSRCLEIIKNILNNTQENLLFPIIVVTCYIIILLIIASILFKKRLESDNK